MSIPCGLPPPPNKKTEKRKTEQQRRRRIITRYEYVYVIEHIFLCKKSYIDILEYVNSEGHTILDQHVRMTGFPTSCVEYYANDTTYQYYMFTTNCMVINLLNLI